VGSICPSLDVTVVTEEFGNEFPVVKANDWKEIEGGMLLARVSMERFVSNDDCAGMRDLKGDDGTIYGRAKVSIMFSDSTVTIGGLSSGEIVGIDGILLGEALGSARNEGRAIVPEKVLKEWATEQAKLYIASSDTPYWNEEIFPFLYSCGAELSHFPFIQGSDKRKGEDELFSLNSFKEKVKSLDYFIVCENNELQFQEGYDENITPRAFEDYFSRRDEVYGFPSSYAHGDDWLDKQEVEFFEFVEEILQGIVTEAWGKTPVIQGTHEIVGEVEGEEVERSVVVFSKGD